MKTSKEKASDQHISAFITDDFLLENEAARTLYHTYGEALPILDFHSHLDPEWIASDARFDNLAQLWLAGDHYAWRAMRASGIDERYISGDAPDWEKFQKWAETVPQTLGNPLYHWVHMALQKPFGIRDRLFGPKTAEAIWEHCRARLQEEDFSCRGILRQMNVALVCTTDDPCDCLEHHRKIAEDATCDIQVLPTFRPDRALAVKDPARFNSWVDQLAAAADVDIKEYSSYLDALRKRHGFFHDAGCRISDHGLESVPAEDSSEAGVRSAFDRLRSGEALSGKAAAELQSAVLHELAVMNLEKGWVQQFHIGALRNTNTRLLSLLGADAGCDSIGDSNYGRSLAKFLDRLDQKDRLAKTILYNLNPRDNEMIVSLAGSFQDGSVPGKIQVGSAWWFLDQKDGIERQLSALSHMGLLSRFVGMVSDSRSFLSFNRHEYFRRVLCNFLGRDIERGLLPRDFRGIGSLIKDICYRNAAEYFGFERLRPGDKGGERES